MISSGSQLLDSFSPPRFEGMS